MNNKFFRTILLTNPEKSGEYFTNNGKRQYDVDRGKWDSPTDDAPIIWWMSALKLPNDLDMKNQMHKEPADQDYDRGFKDCYKWFTEFLTNQI